MSQIKNYIAIILLSISTLTIVAQNSASNEEAIKIHMENHIIQASFDIERNNYFNAENNLKQAIEYAKELGDTKKEGELYTKLARVSFAIDKLTEASQYLNKAAKIQRNNNDYENLAITYNVWGMLHYSEEKYDIALDYFNSAKTKFEEENLNHYIPEVSLNQARVYIKKEDYQSAKTLLETAIVLAKKYGQSHILSIALINSGKVYMHLNNIEAAINTTNEGLEIAKSNNFLESINESYLTLSYIYQNSKKYKQANEYLLKHIKLSDSITELKQKNLSPEQRAQFLSKYKDAENEQLKAQMAEQEEDNNLTKITTILSIALITILSLLTLSLYKNNNIRLKTNNMLHKKNEELIIAKEKAELASKTKANFLSTVTHELRTPLYAVTGLTDMLLEEDPKPEQIPHLKSLKFSGDYLLTFINDILQINKIEANKVELDPEIFNLKTKVENVISALNQSALNNNVKIHFEYDKDLPETFEADQLKISQILINLIGNSIKFTKDGDIWVRIHKINNDKDNYIVKFEVEDNGIGISKEKQENMFESFSQGSIQINRKYGGTGLGLSIVKGLVEILKGKIYLKSELGKGSTFTFEIPLTYVQEAINSKKKKDYSKAIGQLDLSNVKILVVEDNKINQMITKKILNKMNLNCDIVDNGKNAVEKVKETDYSVVLMDIHMPGISGIEATKLIRTFNKELPIFALTAVTLEDKMQEFEEAGFNDIISKPFKQDDFEKKLYSALTKNKKSTII